MDFSVIRRRKKSPKKPVPPAPPKAPPPQLGPLSPYMEDLGRPERLKSMVYANKNFDGYPVGERGVDYNHNYHHPMLTGAPPRMAPPLPSHAHAPPPQLAPTNYGPPRMALPQPDYHHVQPDNQYGPPPPQHHYGGYFSDENPNGCVVM